MIINMYVIFNKRTMHTNNFYTYISPYDVLCCVICARLMCCMYKQLYKEISWQSKAAFVGGGNGRHTIVRNAPGKQFSFHST